MLSDADSDLARRDPILPGLVILLDSDSFVASLRPFVGETDVSSARITYIRYKPRTNCLAAFQLQLAGTMVDGYAKAYGHDAREKLRSARERSTVSGPLGPGCIILEDCGIAVFFFPNDTKLKTLVRLAERDARKAMLCELVPDQPDLWAGMIHRLRYKPERRYVGQLITIDGARAVLKVYTEPVYRVVRSNLKVLGSQASLKLARGLGYSDRHRVVAYEWLPGRPLHSVIMGSKIGLRAVATAGAALAVLHAQDPAGLAWMTPDSPSPPHLLAVADQLGFLSPPFAGRAHDLARRLAAHLAERHRMNHPIHGDFYAQQLLFDQDSVAILDLDRVVRGEPATDIGRFIAHLERDALCGELPFSHVESLRDALLQGYRSVDEQPSDARIDLYTAEGLLQLAAEPFRFREPDWPERIETILDRVEAILRTVSLPLATND